MRMKKVAFLALVALSTSARAGDFWSQDKLTNAAIIGVNVVTAMDWAQTRHIADNPGRFSETGAAAEYIGAHPTTRDVNEYFVKTLLVWNTVGYFLPEQASILGVTFNPKQVFYIGLAAYEGNYVYNNHELGIRMQF